MSTTAKNTTTKKGTKSHPFRRAVLRGLGVVTPPLLTIILFIWAWATIESYVLKPMENGIGGIIVFYKMQSEVKDSIPSKTDPMSIHVADADGENVPIEDVMRIAGNVESIVGIGQTRHWRVQSFRVGETVFVAVAGDKFIPAQVRDIVNENPGDLVTLRATAREYYQRYVKVKLLPRWRVIPVFLIVFVTLLYLLGKFLAAGVGRMFLTGIEALINRLPVVRNVYSSVKQVTDFIFSEREIEYTRVVAVQYPRKGIWSIGFVTGESMLDIRSAANEPVLSVLMPTSPMPATGFTITVRKRETIDLDITIDQAIQFVVSCGVVVPSNQHQDEIRGKISASIARQLPIGTLDGPPSDVISARDAEFGGPKSRARRRDEISPADVRDADARDADARDADARDTDDGATDDGDRDSAAAPPDDDGP